MCCFQGWQVGRVGPVEPAAGALEADRAGAAAGLDVGRFGAVAEWHRDRCPLVGGRAGERRGVARGVGGQRADGADGLLLALEADPVIAHGGGHRYVVHELFEHVNGHSGVGVPLGVRMAQRVGSDQGRIERDRPPVRSAQLAVDRPDLGDPGLERPGHRRGGQVPVGSLGAQQRAGEQPVALRGRGGQRCAALFPAHDGLRGAGGDRQPAAHPARLVVVVDEVVLAAGDLDAAGVQADHLAGAPAGVAQDLVDDLVHGLQVGGGDRSGPPGRAEQVQAGVQAADHRIRQGLADLVFVGFLPDPQPAGRDGRCRAPGSSARCRGRAR